MSLVATHVNELIALGRRPGVLIIVSLILRDGRLRVYVNSYCIHESDKTVHSRADAADIGIAIAAITGGPLPVIRSE